MLFDGENILSPKQDLNLLRSRIGMVFQKPTPFPMSIYENIAFGIRLYEKLPKSELDGRVEDALRRAALWDEVKDKLNANGLSLSGGQQQRLCIARTVAVKPEVILFDEPCSALDPISTAKIEELIDELKNDYTIVIVTHNMQQAARVSDFTAFMYLGELIEFGATSKIFTAPERQAHAGLHHRPLRLSARSAAPSWKESDDDRTYRRSAFDDDLQELDRMIAEMGGLAEKQIAESLRRADQARHRARPAGDRRPTTRIDALQREIEEQVRADHRPPPADGGRSARGRQRAARRQRSRAHRRSRQEHRQARIALTGDFHPAKLIRGVEHMAALVLAQLKDVLDAYSRARRSTRRCAVWRGDEEIDALYTSLFRELLTYMMEDPRNITFCTHLLFCAKNIERIGDHATNIAETVHYLIDGRPITDQRPKGDTTTIAALVGN